MTEYNTIPDDKNEIISDKVHRKVRRNIGRAVKATHHHVAAKPHAKMMSKWGWYNSWHSWNFRGIHHGHVHVMTAMAWLLAVVFFVGSNTANIYAISTWNQSDWSSGVGTDTSNQYSSASNINTANSGEISLSEQANLLSNSSFDSDLTSWNGIGQTQQTSEKYSGAGAVQVTSGASSSDAFYGYANYTGSSAQFNISAGDLNGDGRDDVAITGDDGIYVHNAASDGSLGSASFKDGLGSDDYYDVKIVDVDNDGDNDVVATINASQQYFSIYKNNGSGTLTRSDYDLGVTVDYCSVVNLDIDEDGFQDLAFTCYNQSSFYYTINDGGGDFPTVTSVSGLARAQGYGPNIVTGDFNGDDNQDVAIGAYTGSGVCDFSFSLGTGSTLATATTYDYTGGGCGNQYSDGIAAGDINEDGRDDIAIARRVGTSYYLTTFQGTAGGSFTSQADLTAASVMGYQDTTVLMSDINNDGNLDLTSTNGNSTNKMYYFEGNGDGTFDAFVNYSPGISANKAHTVADLSGDGKLDVVSVQYLAPTSLGNVSVLANRTIGDPITQSVDVNNTETYAIGGYVRNVAGTAITSADAELFSDGQTISTTFTDAGSGWYKMTGSVTGQVGKTGYGIMVKQGKTLYIDDVYLNQYYDSGTITSAIFDLSYGGDWGTATLTGTNTANVDIKVRTSNDSGMSGATAFSSCNALASGADLTDSTCVTQNQQYIQYELTFNAVSNVTPVVTDVDLTYDAYDNDPPPTNASSILMYKANGGSSVSSNGWTNGQSPYFTWTAGIDSGSSGIKGYCAYLGTDASADPISTKGLLGDTPTATNGACQFITSTESLDLASISNGSPMTSSNSSYYLNLKAIDNADNIFAGSSAQFQFRFDNTAPTNPTYVSAPSSYINTKVAEITWPSGVSGAAADSNSGVAGLQYQINASGWYGDVHNGAGDITDLLTDDGSYTTTPDAANINEGVNIVYLRTWDSAGNVSSGTVSVALKINTSSAPSAPVGVSATPTTNTTNAFAFSWSDPTTFSGSADNLTFCYTVNATPNAGNCTFTTAGVNSLSEDSYATQPGENTFYLVAKDEAGNINYSNSSQVSFYANTPAPGIPTNLDVLDASIKSTSNWRLAVTWDEPSDTGTGIASYQVYRSTDNSNFTLAGTSSSTTYVDAGLSQVDYYYKIKACDSANQCSAFSSVDSEKPTGKFTVPANITSQPLVTNVTTKKARVSWSTDRDSDSKILIGTSSGAYADSEVGNSTQTTSHVIDLDNLSAGTTYYAKAKWTDGDGNTGSSQEFTFTTSAAPLLKEVETLNVSLSTATVKFTTQSATRAVVYYGQTESFGGATEINTSTTESTYSIGLEGLDDGVKYLYKIGLFDSEGAQYQSSIFTFSTPPRPVISNVRFQPVPDEPTSTQMVSWTTNVPTTSSVNYGLTGQTGVEIVDNELKTQHEIIVKNLLDNSEYSLVAQGRDASGNLATSDKQVFKTALDTRPPKVSDIIIETSIRGSGEEARGQIIVSWKTDEPSTSQVAYAEGSDATEFNNRTAEDATLTTEHLVIISELQTSKAYTIMPVSNDNAKNTGEGERSPAIIGRATDSVLNIVLDTLRKVFGF